MAVRTVDEKADALLSFDELRAQLRAVGEERYHHKHPFHLMMHEGRLSRGQLQAWALNRYYYQSMIPVKDSIILSRGPDPAFRRSWRSASLRPIRSRTTPHTRARVHSRRRPVPLRVRQGSRSAAPRRRP